MAINSGVINLIQLDIAYVRRINFGIHKNHKTSNATNFFFIVW